MKSRWRSTHVVAAVLLCSVGAVPAGAEELTVVAFGGAMQNAQTEAFFKPFTAETGITIRQETWTGDLGKLRAMMEGGKITWDVLMAETAETSVACGEGLLEKLDFGKIRPKSDFIAGGAVDCGAGTSVFATIIAYDTARLAGKPPLAAADFFDTATWPGKRGLRKTPKNVLELALMADGVAPAEVYKVLATDDGARRAFRKLDSIKPSIVWWEVGSQPAKLLADGAAVMTTGFSGAIQRAIAADGRSFGMIWDRQIYEIDFWTIPKGSPHKAAALQFIAYASRPEVMRNQSRWIALGPAVTAAVPLVEPAVVDLIPTNATNMKTALANDAAFWSQHFDELNEQFQSWLAK